MGAELYVSVVVWRWGQRPGIHKEVLLHQVGAHWRLLRVVPTEFEDIEEAVLRVLTRKTGLDPHPNPSFPMAPTRPRKHGHHWVVYADIQVVTNQEPIEGWVWYPHLQLPSADECEPGLREGVEECGIMRRAF